MLKCFFFFVLLSLHSLFIVAVLTKLNNLIGDEYINPHK